MQLGFIGLGIMGKSMAANLLKAGWPVTVNDIRRDTADGLLDAGASWAESPAAMAERCDVIFSCLPDLRAIESVALGPDGILSRARHGTALFEMSTNSPELIRRIHHAFREKGAHMLDAPVSGAAAGASSGRLAMWVGGDRDAFDRARPALDAMADRVTFVGPSGSGIVTKLVHNCSSQTLQAALAEVFVMGVKAGADPVALWEAIRQGSIGRRRTFDGMIDEFLPGRYESPSAALRIVHKDMTIATGLARELGVPMRLANLALADLTEAMNRGWSERDARCVMLLPQERVGVQIAEDPERIQAVLDRDPAAPTDTRRGKP
jgi:3-hydroxyisobutyrate dehydrogenase-like beta-hydroxyacid dehydrogenase